MNSIIVLPEELIRDGEKTIAHIKGERALYLLSTHELSVGVTQKAGVLGGKRGIATVSKASPEEVVLTLVLDQEPLPRIGVHLIVAVPRPQTIKKIVQLATATGVDGIHFIRSENSEKNYLQSKSLRPSELQDEVLKSLEQVRDTISPLIVIYKSLNEFLSSETNAPLFRNSRSFFADEKGDVLCESPLLKESGGVILSIGPEKGWSDTERKHFITLGWTGVSLGLRMFRVEHAAALLLGALMRR